jgi:hypothetical protein
LHIVGNVHANDVCKMEFKKNSIKYSFCGSKKDYTKSKYILQKQKVLNISKYNALIDNSFGNNTLSNNLWIINLIFFSIIY